MAQAKWTEANKTWVDNTWKWSDVELVVELVEAVVGGGRGAARRKAKEWPEEKQKQLIKLICKVKGVEYIEEKYKKEGIKVTAKDIEMLAEAVLGIKLDVSVKEN